MPMEPAKEVSIVLAFFVSRLFTERESAVQNDMDGFFFLPLFLFGCAAAQRAASSSVYGSESSVISPSSRRIILVEYFCASSGLWVTIITRRSFATSLSSSII